MKKIKKYIYYENKYFGATVGALLFSKDTVLVDAPLKPEDARGWLASLGRVGAKSRRLVINLDAHPDRTLGTQTLESHVLAHRETARQFRRRAAIFKTLKQESGAEWEETSGLSGLRWILPRVTFSEDMLLHFDDRELRLELHPGPGPGACWLILPADKVVFVGDAVVQGQPPFLAQADIEAWMDALDLLLSRPYRDYIVISGRGGRVGPKDINSHKRLLKEVQSRMQRVARKKNTAHAEIEKLAVRLAERYKAPAKRHHLYVQRLKYGLHNYYTRHFLPGAKSQNSN